MGRAVGRQYVRETLPERTVLVKLEGSCSECSPVGNSLALLSHDLTQGEIMPGRSWSDKDERQYEHIKKSELERGRSEDRAEEIAARTVNKERFEEGRTETTRSRATGNPNLRYEDRTLEELANLARERHITGASEMSKKDLILALRNQEGE